MVQLECDKEEEPCYGLFGTLLAELEVKRTLKRAEQWALTMALASLIDIWDSLMNCAERIWDPHVKHVKAHRTEKEKKTMTSEEQIVMEGMRRQTSWRRMERKWMEEQMAAAKALTIKLLRK